MLQEIGGGLMARRIVRSCLQTLLKVMNCVMAIVGIAMILYGLWMIRVWQRDMKEAASFYSTAPWFIYAFLGLGLAVCLITCIGYIAAGSANGCCLSCYVTVVSLLVLFESAISADILLNSDWEKDLPEDPTGRFTDFEDFVKSNFDIFKWIGLLIALNQGLSILLSMVLRSIGSYNDDSNDDDRFPTAKLPLLNPSPPPPHPYIIKGDPLFAPKK